MHTEPIITVCCWTDIVSVRTKFQLRMVGHMQYKSDQASAKLDLTFTDVDLTNVRCQTVILALCTWLNMHLLGRSMNPLLGSGSSGNRPPKY